MIVVAIGQNDASPVDIMKEDYESSESKHWRAQYEVLIKRLRGLYPDAVIVCATTLLMHDPSWDKAIDEKITAEDSAARVYHFMYKRNGAATPGHPRISEHNEMATELAEFIRELT